MFDKSLELFPIKKNYAFFAHCAVSPLFSKACAKEIEVSKKQQDAGLLFIKEKYIEILESFREAAGRLLKTSPDNIAFVKNTSEGMSIVANGYRFNPSDQVIGYTHEYPANYYPWKLQAKRCVEFIELPNRQREDTLCFGNLPMEWTFADLEERITSRTRIVAVSHVQFTSGYAANLKVLGDFCLSKNIDLVVDVAQSLGSLPVYPEEYNISALASSGWKWLLGPTGTGLVFTSAKFREKLDHVLVGAETMRQGTAYLDRSWDPHFSARRFEYSTSPISLVAALERCLTCLPFSTGMEPITAEIFRLQDLLVNKLSPDLYMPLVYPKENRSGILSVICKRHHPSAVVEALLAKRVVCTERDGFLRFAPHFYNSDEEVEKTVSILNAIDR